LNIRVSVSFQRRVLLARFSLKPIMEAAKFIFFIAVFCSRAQTASTCYTETNRISGWWCIIKLVVPNKIKKNESSRKYGKLHRKSAFRYNAMRRKETFGSFLVQNVREKKLCIEDCQLLDIFFMVIFDCESIVHQKFVPKRPNV